MPTQQVERGADFSAVAAALFAGKQVARQNASRVLIDRLGPIDIARLKGGLKVRGEPEVSGVGPGENCTFILQVNGEGELQQLGNRVRLGRGDLALYDGGFAYSYSSARSCEVIVMRVPSTMVASNLPDPRFLLGQRLASEEPLVATVGAMAVTLADQLRDGLEETCRKRAANHLVGMISSCYVPMMEKFTGQSAVMACRLWRVKMFIEENLRDPKLSPSLVARQLNLSSRYLRMIFASGDETILSYILRRRLEECSARLSDQQWRGHSITEIAFSWGFNSAPHFTRTFRERFGVSPREYRQRELLKGEGLHGSGAPHSQQIAG